MNKLDFNIPLISIEGKPVEKKLAGELAYIIGTETEGRTIKLYDWYKKLQVGDILELDDADTNDLEKLIEENKRLLLFAKGQMLDVIKAARK